MKLIFIVAMTSDRLIGNAGKLPWHVPEDLKFFKRTTTGHAVIMGRKTYESMNKPLPNRRNIVISRQPGYVPPTGHSTVPVGASERIATSGGAGGGETSLDVVHSLEEALELCRSRNERDAFIIGGAQIFEAAMGMVDEMIITRIEGDYEGDVFFPKWDASEWEEAGPVDPTFPAATRWVRLHS